MQLFTDCYVYNRMNAVIEPARGCSNGLESACYQVRRFSRHGAERQLLAVGASPELVKKMLQSLPDGLPFLVSADTHMPVAPVILYIHRLWARPKTGATAPRGMDTAIAQAYDICDFLEHLDAYGRTYDDIDQEMFDRFADNQSTVPSARTGKILTSATIRRRLAHVAGFLTSKEFSTMGKAVFDKSLTSVGGRTDESEIHPLTAGEWTLLVDQLGPLPSARKSDESSLLRLFSEWAIRTGARRIELAGLRSSEIRKLISQSDANLDATLVTTLNVTKGGVPRRLWVPSDLIEETRIYMEGERAEALSSLNRSDHGRLFCNPASVRGHAGAPVQRDTITRWFGLAVRRAGLKRRYVGGNAVSKPGDHFVLHDLRHTYAVWTYIALEHAGQKRPWKTIQSRLGHRLLETTERIYLAFIEDHEAEISNLLQKHYRGWDFDGEA